MCLIRWIDATEFQSEIDELDQAFQEYGFTTIKWLLLNKNSYRDLMRKTLDFIESGDDQENLFILYYAGHGRMNTARQAEWISHVGQDTPSLDCRLLTRRPSPSFWVSWSTSLPKILQIQE